jgi:aspartate kinase
MKFGGAAVAAPERFARIADIILERKRNYQRIAVVVSAMGDTTDQLITLARQVNPNPPRREYDMLVSVGERISISLLAMALANHKYNAVSFTGSQSGIITCGNHSEARIIDVRPHRLLPVLDSGSIAIVAGFQGVSRKGEITTLGRGGSDTSAVALAAALGAHLVEFYKDVPGIFAEDPKVNPQAQFLPYLSYEDALQIIQKGAQVLQERSVSLASRNGIPLHVRSFLDPGLDQPSGTIISSDEGTRACQPLYEEEMAYDTNC